MTTDLPYEWNALLGRLAGFRLYSVQFVLDYVQLHLDRAGADGRPMLTCDLMPVVQLGERHVGPREPGYVDALVSLVTSHVVSTREAQGEGLRIELDRGILVLRPVFEDLVGPEIALLSGFEDSSWMCWRPGEEAFEYLA